MFSLKERGVDSFPIAVIKDADKKKAVVETIYYTELKRPVKGEKVLPPEPPIEKLLSKYVDRFENNTLYLNEDYRFEMVPTIADGSKTKPRFVNYYLSSANSGKSYRIAEMCRRYLQANPDNLVAYCSANPLDKDHNYDDIRDKMKEVDPLKLDAPIDFQDPDFANSLWIFDDCDSGFTGKLQDVDDRLTDECLNELSITQKFKAKQMVSQQCALALKHVNDSIMSFLKNGRKYSQSVCFVAHKPNGGSFENTIINEATGVILFPASTDANILEEFLIKKLSVTKAHAASLVYGQHWYQYDFLFIPRQITRRFAMGDNFIKLLI